MIKSIRSFIFINLLLGLTLMAGFVLLSDLYISHSLRKSLIEQSLKTSFLQIQHIDSDQTTSLKQKEKKIQTILSNLAPDQTPALFVDNAYKINIISAKQPTVSLTGVSEQSQNIPAPDYKQTGLTIAKKGKQTIATYIHREPQLQKTIDLSRVINQKYSHNLYLRDQLLLFAVISPLLILVLLFTSSIGLRSIQRITDDIKLIGHQPNKSLNIETIPREIKPLITELYSTMKKLQKSLDKEKRFAADAAHELRTPLAALSAQLQVALNCEDINECKTILAKILEAVHRSTHVVAQLLTISRMSSTSDLEKEIFHLQPCIQQIMADLAISALDKDIDLELKCNLPRIQLFGSQTSIAILARNLIDNAIRYTQNGGKVTVSITEDNHSPCLIVEDNGPGIAPELRERVFERFYRELGTEQTGCGLGLGIVIQIAELHRARITLDSPPLGTGLIAKVQFLKIDNNH